MKRVLLAGTALVGLAIVSAPAHADIKTDISGFFRGYGVYADNHEPAGDASSLRKFEFRRDSEIHANGETTLENGLTIGAHTEFKIGNGSSAVTTDETYAYGSGGWGRFNFGVEDGAAYLLQVAAPSADSNVDGMRNYINGTGTVSTAGENLALALSNSSIAGKIGYDQADFRQTDRLTYLTPKFNGFQAGVSYAPKPGFASNTDPMSLDKSGLGFVPVVNGAAGSTAVLSAAAYKDLWEASARYDGEFQGFGFSLGGGYSDSTLQQRAGAADLTAAVINSGDYYLDSGLKSWNGGVNVAFSGFSLGGAYLRSDTTRVTNGDQGGVAERNTGDITNKTWVVGGGYDNGPYHAGASYVHSQVDLDGITQAGGGGTTPIAASWARATSTTVGGGYTYGPGMTFRGSISDGKYSTSAGGADNNRFTQVAIGTDIQF